MFGVRVNADWPTENIPVHVPVSGNGCVVLSSFVPEKPCFGNDCVVWSSLVPEMPCFGNSRVV